jgi:hypothetical protein
MELTVGSKTLVNHNLTPGKYPKEYIQYSKHGETHFMYLVNKKLKLKSLPGAFSTLQPHGSVFLPQQVPTFISRGATHHTDARDLYQQRRELLLMNFDSKSGIYEIH